MNNGEDEMYAREQGFSFAVIYSEDENRGLCPMYSQKKKASFLHFTTNGLNGDKLCVGY